MSVKPQRQHVRPGHLRQEEAKAEHVRQGEGQVLQAAAVAKDELTQLRSNRNLPLQSCAPLSCMLAQDTSPNLGMQSWLH